MHGIRAQLDPSGVLVDAEERDPYEASKALGTQPEERPSVPRVARRTPPLRDFMIEHREELHRIALEKMAQKSAADRSQPDPPVDFKTVFDEIIRALGQDMGLPERSPLPGKSDAAARRGRQRLAIGDTIDKISFEFGSISDAVGELGHRHGLGFDARDYQIFNLSIDSAIAAAIEAYWNEAREEEGYARAERMGFFVHELRNALWTAQMAFTTLKRNHMGVESRTGDVLGRGLTRLEGLISNAVLAVKLKSGVQPRPQRLRVRPLLHDIEDAAGPPGDVRVVVEADEELEVEADEGLLTSAISNLLQNALKFTHRPGTVTLRGRRCDGDVILEVEDECGGLPPGKKEELFQPFVQRGRDRGGLGLGLAITREAVEAQGGELMVRDLPGTGCVFAVKLRSPER